MPFACIYLPNFPVAAALRAEPELRALAIYEGKAPLEKVIAVDPCASRMGIAPGMSKTQVELCPEVALRARSLLLERAAHAALLDCAQSFSPCVEDTAWNTALIDLAGMESLFGSLPEISSAIAHCATELGLNANVSIASHPDAAMIAARGFAGVTVIPSGKETEQLGPLPLKVLCVDEFGSGWPNEPDSARHDFPEVGNSLGVNRQNESGLLETLERWGIRDLRALAALPEVALSERLGQQGLRMQQLARGTASRTLVPLEEPSVFEEAVELEHPVVLLEPLAFLLNRLLEQICARLGSRALATQELRLTLELNSFYQSEIEFQRSCRESETKKSESFSRTLRLPLPMLDSKLFLKLLQLDLNAHPPGAPIVKIHLAAEPARQRSAQGGLFLPPSPEPEKLELTLARISSMVGENKVGAIELLDTHNPEGFRMRRFANAGVTRAPARMAAESCDARERQSPVTALRRFRPPLHAEVALKNGQPARVFCRKKEVRGQVLWKAGPWRASGDWWDRRGWSRDEWDVALQIHIPARGDSIALFRLVHDLLGGGWFVEGSYD